MNTRRLTGLLHDSRNLAWVVRVCTALVRASGIVLVASLAAVIVDAMFGLSVAGLVSLDVLLIVVAVFGVGMVIRRLLQFSADERRTAVQIEQRLGLTDSRLINAVEVFLFSRTIKPIEILFKNGKTIALMNV